MRIKIEQMLFGGKLLSWSNVAQNIGRELLKLNHNVEFISTDGIKTELLPKDLKPYLKKVPFGLYDIQISYTIPKNAPSYLSHGDKNRFNIYNYDASVLPAEMTKYHQFYDYICPSSNFAAQTFVNAKIPKDKIKVIPHGIDLDSFKNNKNKYSLKTNKKYKILWNLATPHLRKNVRNTFKIYGESFSKSDDVCLVIKANLKYTQKSDSLDFNYELNKFKKDYPNHGDMIVITEYLPDLVELYNACDIILMLSNFECWALPCSDGLAAEKLVIASNYGGQLHYLNNNNSLLVDGKVVRMPRKYFYWEPNIRDGEMFEPSIEDSINKLRYAIDNYDNIIINFLPKIKETTKEFTWEKAVQKLLELTI